MGMYQNIQDFVQILWADEELLRLLHYKPKNLRNRIPDPLDESLPNILEIDKDWTIRNQVIMVSPKEDDLTNKSLCCLFVYLGDREPSRGNYLTANQEVFFDILCHSDFENGDMRSYRIADRLNELFVQQRVTGIGKTDYISGRIVSSVPSQYTGYRHIYSFGSFKK
ncbi:hypothetical protein [Cytobacillus horneckiae]|uniref:Uncharacterized protein n=1 Tax=Cytobacillus horneckiae TaxID=549687 RepID=A0A2N0ZFA6_9BACI|nr:hypothetical protein [Cytobacillus horneckiae]MEC1155634.1 hypothetical protein [Cytobacillus horneckiae]MED2936952.1 hypothetical protein [Cytobacillus horneckiae]PKG28188.1 hypothetical protein CWS20_15200 [Cytobacillus horneckiae]